MTDFINQSSNSATSKDWLAAIKTQGLESFTRDDFMRDLGKAVRPRDTEKQSPPESASKKPGT